VRILHGNEHLFMQQHFGSVEDHLEVVRHYFLIFVRQSPEDVRHMQMLLPRAWILILRILDVLEHAPAVRRLGIA